MVFIVPRTDEQRVDGLAQIGIRQGGERHITVTDAKARNDFIYQRTYGHRVRWIDDVEVNNVKSVLSNVALQPVKSK